jgi:membrane-bound transcription factor site-1 protease
VIEATASEIIWPWSGYLVVSISVANESSTWSGISRGWIQFRVQSRGSRRNSQVIIPIAISVIPTPPRSRRLLWDQYHSLYYPSGYFPNDNLKDRTTPLDWHADHPFTNFMGLYSAIAELGYFLEILQQPLTCFDASEYAALLIVDAEEEFTSEEIDKVWY